MELEERKKLSKEWVMVMIYNNPMSLDGLVKNGCRVMLFGWKLPEFKNILKEMVINDLTIEKIRNVIEYSLTTDGLFYIKKNTLLPLIQISEDPNLLTSFIRENKTKCDTEFLERLSNQSGTNAKESTIQEFAKNNYEKIAVILIALIPFLLTYA